MGRRMRNARKHRDRKPGNSKSTDNRPDRRSAGYIEIVKHNDAFIRYYKHSKICTDKEFDEEFLEALRQPLPTTFRITGFRSAAKRLLSLIQSEFYNTYVVKDENETGDEESLATKPFCLPWYPNEMGWQLELTRKDIRRSEKYYKLHNFLIAETNGGSISRQEAVSMIPPLVLDVKPHHKVLGSI